MPLPFYPITKQMQTHSTRQKPTQRQMGGISPKVREEVKDRTMSHCELFHVRRDKCKWVAQEMAHITGRKQLNRVTTADDILHVCIPCHRWLDGTPDGIKFKRTLLNEKAE